MTVRITDPAKEMLIDPDEHPTRHHTRIGKVGNAYANGVEIDRFMGNDGVVRWYWTIEDVFEAEWEPIPDYLAEALLKFRRESLI